MLPQMRAVAGSATKSRILVVKSRDVAFYDATLAGFTKGLKSRGYGSETVDVQTISLTDDHAKNQQILLNELQKSNRLIITLGTDATTAVAAQRPIAPCLFSLVLDPVSLGLVQSINQPGGDFTGTTLLVSPGKQLDELQQVDPKIARIGVLYTAGDSTSINFLNSAVSDAKRLNITVQAVAVNPSDNKHDLLEQMSSKVDALWLILDPASAGPQALSDTFEVAKEHHLPVLGTSSANVREGALLALSADLQDEGDVDAEMAAPLLEGSETPESTPVRGPRQTVLTVNLGAAAALGLTVPDSVLHLADEVIDDSSH